MCSERAFFLEEEEEEGEFNSSSSFLFYYISFVISAGMRQEVWVYTLCNAVWREGAVSRFIWRLYNI